MNFVKLALDNGGIIRPLIIPSELNSGLGIMNPSIYNHDGKIIVNLRAVNYTFYHSEKKIFQHPYGPLTYLHPEDDLKLRTWNYYLELDDDYSISRVDKIDTSKFPEKELWDFIGLEDARIFEWENKLYTCGVRRDLDDIGTGRMELCEIEVHDDKVVEVSRFRIPTPGKDDEYCSKNWMPIIDKPYHFVKWSNPTQVVKVDPDKKTCVTTNNGEVKDIPRDIRGGSQVVPWKDYYVAITHEVDLFNSETGRKDAIYRHRIVFWDKEFNLIKWTDDFSIMGGQVEFCVGLAQQGSDFLMTFGFQDNAAYLIKFPEKIFEDIVHLDKKFKDFNWGPVDEEYIRLFHRENFVERTYERHFKVQENDVVLDLGANCGSFTFSILENNPKHVFCVEPSASLVDTLKTNIEDYKDKVTIINKAISDHNSDSEVIPDKDVFIYNHDKEYQTITFKDLIKSNNITKIDFLKSDCEGGEYFVFTEENADFIKENVKRITGEFHVTGWTDSLEKFKIFRDNYLNHIRYSGGLHVYERSGIDVSEKIFDDQYLKDFYDYWNKANPYRGQFIVYVDYELAKKSTKDIEDKDVPTIEIFSDIDIKTEYGFERIRF